jgi:hypothetical protein
MWSAVTTVCAKPGCGGSSVGDVDWRLDGALLDTGDDVLATYRVHARGRGSGVEVAQRLTLIWTIRDAKVTRVRAYSNRSAALEAWGCASRRVEFR